MVPRYIFAVPCYIHSYMVALATAHFLDKSGYYLAFICITGVQVLVVMGTFSGLVYGKPVRSTIHSVNCSKNLNPLLISQTSLHSYNISLVLATTRFGQIKLGKVLNNQKIHLQIPFS